MLTLNVPMTIDRIARETKFGKSVVAKYVSALKRAGLVRTSKTKRNKIVVQACVGPTR